MRQRTAWGLLGVIFGLLLAAPGALAADEPPKGAKPLPIKRTTTVRGMGTTWYVDGPIVIPPHVELRIELGTKIIGINDASIEVQGGLKVHGTEDYWVVMKILKLERQQWMVFRWEPGQNSALDSTLIAQGADVGNVTAQRNGEDVPYFVDFAFAFHAFFPEAIIHTK